MCIWIGRRETEMARCAGSGHRVQVTNSRRACASCSLHAKHVLAAGPSCTAAQAQAVQHRHRLCSTGAGRQSDRGQCRMWRDEPLKVSLPCSAFTEPMASHSYGRSRWGVCVLDRAAPWGNVTLGAGVGGWVQRPPALLTSIACREQCQSNAPIAPSMLTTDCWSCSC
jgi:hypothetical protein